MGKINIASSSSSCLFASILLCNFTCAISYILFLTFSFSCLVKLLAEGMISGGFIGIGEELLDELLVKTLISCF
jgi:hypothetical protein